MNNSIVNYFIILTLDREKYEPMFQKKWCEYSSDGEIKAVLLKRKTGNMQFYSHGDYNAKGFEEILKSENFNKLIGEKEVLKNLLENYEFGNVAQSTFISELKKPCKIISNKIFEIEELTKEDIDEVIQLYELCFKGFATRQSMMDKFDENTGRGYCIKKEGKIICAVQTSYEQDNSAIITGLATSPAHRNQGFGAYLLNFLCDELMKEGKTPYLQYDNEDAGRIYKRLGFQDIGRMLLCYK